jgi:heme/copper-type cytochrome/quinol oxidase subunit 2
MTSGSSADVPRVLRIRLTGALAFAGAALLLSVGYATMVLTQLHDTSSSSETRPGDPSVGAAINRAVENTTRAIGVTGLVVCVPALVAAVCVARATRRRTGPEVERRALVLAAMWLVPACIILGVLAGIVFGIYWNTTQTSF